MRRPAIGFMFLGAALVMATGCSGSRSDNSIANAIKAKMYSDPQVKSADISVDVKNGVVTLTGSVSDENTRYEAFKVASETRGVSKVNDQMAVDQTQEASTSESTSPAPGAPSETASNTNRPHENPYGDLPRRTLGGAHVDTSQQDPPANSSAPANAAPAAPAAQTEAASPPPPQPQLVTVPAGTSVRVQMIDSVDSSVNKVGQIFHASLAEPLVVNNQVIVPAGADIYLVLTNQASAGHIEGRSELSLQLDHLQFQGATYPLSSTVYQKLGTSRGKRSAETIGGAAAIGALLGGIFGHGKGAAIGAAAGAGGGTIAQEATKPAPVRITSETKIDFTLQQPVTITLQPGQ